MQLRCLSKVTRNWQNGNWNVEKCKFVLQSLFGKVYDSLWREKKLFSNINRAILKQQEWR